MIDLPFSTACRLLLLLSDSSDNAKDIVTHSDDDCSLKIVATIPVVFSAYLSSDHLDIPSGGSMAQHEQETGREDDFLLPNDITAMVSSDANIYFANNPRLNEIVTRFFKFGLSSISLNELKLVVHYQLVYTMTFVVDSTQAPDNAGRLTTYLSSNDYAWLQGVAQKFHSFTKEDLYAVHKQLIDLGLEYSVDAF
jgi:hypothetical protein